MPFDNYHDSFAKEVGSDFHHHIQGVPLSLLPYNTNFVASLIHPLFIQQVPPSLIPLHLPFASLLAKVPSSTRLLSPCASRRFFSIFLPTGYRSFG
jgi:hypothetical protein